MKKVFCNMFVVLFAMVAGCSIVRAGYREDITREMNELNGRRVQYVQTIKNIDVRVAQLQYGLELLSKQDADAKSLKEKKAEKKAAKKAKKAKAKKDKKAKKKKKYKKAVIPVDEKIAPDPEKK